MCDGEAERHQDGADRIDMAIGLRLSRLVARGGIAERARHPAMRDLMEHDRDDEGDDPGRDGIDDCRCSLLASGMQPMRQRGAAQPFRLAFLTFFGGGPLVTSSSIRHSSPSTSSDPYLSSELLPRVFTPIRVA